MIILDSAVNKGRWHEVSPENAGPSGWRSSTEQPPATLVLDVMNLKEQSSSLRGSIYKPCMFQ